MDTQPGVLAPKTQSREVHLFTVPEALAAEVGVREVGMVTLTAAEEMMAHKRAPKRDAVQLALELAKASLVEVDGGKLTLADGSADAFWANAHPKLRELVLSAYADLHSPREEDAASFRASRRVRVG